MSTRPATTSASSSAAASAGTARAARNGGAALGLIVFLVGIALLGYVFYTARVLFDTPPPTIPVPPPAPLTETGAVASTAPSTAPAAAAVVGQTLIGFFERLFVLLLMCIAGSVIASRGIELFFKALAAGSSAVAD